MASRYVVVKTIGQLKTVDSIYTEYEGAVHALTHVRDLVKRAHGMTRVAINGDIEVLSKQGNVIATYSIETRAGFAEGEYNG